MPRQAITLTLGGLLDQGFTIAANEDILARGRKVDWKPLAAAIEADPFGDIAEKTLALCEQDLYGAPVFRRIVAAARRAPA